jgi:hypothetical protein
MFLAELSQRFDGWRCGGSGLTTSGEVDYVSIPIKIAPDNLGLQFHVRKDQ